MKRRLSSSSTNDTIVANILSELGDESSRRGRRLNGHSLPAATSACEHVWQTEAVAGHILSFVDDIETLLRLRRCCRSLRHACTHFAQPWHGRVLVLDSEQRLQCMVPNSMPQLTAVDVDTRSPMQVQRMLTLGTWPPASPVRAAALHALVRASSNVTSLTVYQLLDEDVAAVQSWRLTQLDVRRDSLLTEQVIESNASSLRSLCLPIYAERYRSELLQSVHLNSLRAHTSFKLGLEAIGQMAWLTALRSDGSGTIAAEILCRLIAGLPALTQLQMTWGLPFHDAVLDYSVLQRCSNHQRITHLRGPCRLHNVDQPPVVALSTLSSLRTLQLHRFDRLTNAYLQQISQLRQLTHLEAEKCTADLDWSTLDIRVARSIETLRMPMTLAYTDNSPTAPPNHFVQHLPNVTCLVTAVYHTNKLRPVACDTTHAIGILQQISTLLPRLVHLTLDCLDIGLAAEALPLLAECSQLQILRLQCIVPKLPLDQRQSTLYNALWLPATTLASQLRSLHTLYVLSVRDTFAADNERKEVGCEFSAAQWTAVLQSITHVQTLGFYYAGGLTSMCHALLSAQPRALHTICAMPEYYIRVYDQGAWDDTDDENDEEDGDGWEHLFDGDESDQSSSPSSDAASETVDTFQQLDQSRRQQLLPHIRWTHSMTACC